jgi:hypothetical protein
MLRKLHSSVYLPEASIEFQSTIKQAEIQNNALNYDVLMATDFA